MFKCDVALDVFADEQYLRLITAYNSFLTNFGVAYNKPQMYTIKTKGGTHVRVECLFLLLFYGIISR